MKPCRPRWIAGLFLSSMDPARESLGTKAFFFLERASFGGKASWQKRALLLLTEISKPSISLPAFTVRKVLLICVGFLLKRY